MVLCSDRGQDGAGVAVKVIRRHDRTTGSALYRAAALNELRVLRDLGGRHGTVLLLRDFEHARHMCMAFEALGASLHDAMLARGGAPIEPHSVRDVSHQVRLLGGDEADESKGGWTGVGRKDGDGPKKRADGDTDRRADFATRTLSLARRG